MSNENRHCRIGRVKPKGNIKLFPGAAAPELPVHQQPHDDIVKLLEDTLADARAGKVQGLALAVIDHHHWPWTDYAFGPGVGMPVATMIGALFSVMTKIQDASRRIKSATGDGA